MNLLQLILRGLRLFIPDYLLYMGMEKPYIKVKAIDVQATRKHYEIFYGVFRCDRCSSLLNTGAPPPIGAGQTFEHIDREWTFVFDHWEHRCNGILIEGTPFLVSDIERGAGGEALLPEAAADFFTEPDLTSRATRIIEAAGMADFQMRVSKGVLPRPGEVYRIVATRLQPPHGACMLGEKFASVAIAQEWINLNAEEWIHKYTLMIFPEPGAVEYCKRANILAEEEPQFWQPRPVEPPSLDRAGAPDLERES